MEAKREAVHVPPINLQVAVFHVTGKAPLMQAAFSQKVLLKLRATHEAGSTAKSKKQKEPRNFEQDFRDAAHRSTEGWYGIPASAFRSACIDVCRMVGFKMTHAKMSVFVQADGLDAVNGQPLVRLDAGKPEMNVMAVRNQTGVVDLRARPMWREWGCELRMEFDADQFTLSDVSNLLERAGTQVGIGEGRPFSRESAGLGLGTFTIRSA